MKGRNQTCLMVVCSWTHGVDPGLKLDLSEQLARAHQCDSLPATH